LRENQLESRYEEEDEGAHCDCYLGYA
jgi:hypothetical protein